MSGLLNPSIIGALCQYATSNKELREVIVSGLRASIQKAQDIRRGAPTRVEAIIPIQPFYLRFECATIHRMRRVRSEPK
jgi:hypothetical protein